MEGNILKMKTELKDVVQYHLPIGDDLIHMNPLIGKKLSMSFEGKINCIHSGELIKKSFGQGYSFKSFRTLAQCDMCLVRPETCHYADGTCREPKWGEKHCMIPHYIYLSVASGLKVGITRETNLPFRWMDQGATSALPILKVKDRLTSGLIEVELSKSYADKTNWRKMLKGDVEDVSLEAVREEIYETYGNLIDDYEAEDLDEEVLEISYPIESVPEKISSLSFDKKPLIEGVLTGIKGQYLILDTGVLNIRKH
ncbi:MAG: hypothetical protein ACJARO_000896, partial [Bacteriovoracaceae bacterium]